MEDIFKIELVNKSLAEGIAAGIGLLPIPHLEHYETDNETMLSRLEEHKGPIPYVCCAEKPGFYGRAICRITDSWSGHAGLFVGEENARRIRERHPDILKPHRIPGTTTEAGLLPGVPAEVKKGELIESQITIATNEMRNAVRPGEQVVAFIREWSEEQAEAILYAAYYLYGAPYDIWEIASHVWGWVPNPNSIKVCSSFVECALEGEDPTVERDIDKGDTKIAAWLRTHGVDPEKCAPGHIGRYLFEHGDVYKPVSFNCNLIEAESKI